MKRNVMNKKFLNLSTVFFVLFALLVFCAGCNENNVEEERPVVVSFGVLHESEASRGLVVSQKFQYAIEDLFWSYTATKQDGVHTTGEALTETPVNPSGAGLSGKEITLSQGKWKIKIVAYATAANRTGKVASNVIYSGETVVTLSDTNAVVSIRVSNGAAYSATAGKLEFEASPTIRVPAGMSFTNGSKIVVTVKKGSSAVTSSTTTISGAQTAGTAVTLTNFSTPTNISDGVNTLTVTITYTPSGGTAVNLANGTTGVNVPVLVTAGCTTVIGKDWNGCVTYRP